MPILNIRKKKMMPQKVKSLRLSVRNRSCKKEGGPDPSNNFKLAQVIAKAKSNNMPNDTIDRGIKKVAVMETPSTTNSVHMKDMDQAEQLSL